MLDRMRLPSQLLADCPRPVNDRLSRRRCREERGREASDESICSVCCVLVVLIRQPMVPLHAEVLDARLDRMEVEADVLEVFARDQEVGGRIPAVEVEQPLSPRCDDVDYGSVISPPHGSDTDGDARMDCRAAVSENVARTGREERLVCAGP